MATKYIRKSGSDANNGTNATTDAVLTLARGIAVSTTGDTLDFGAGTWIEDLSTAYSRNFLGAGMFLTIINGTFTGGASAVAATFTDLKILINANFSVAFDKPLTFTRVYCDGNGFGRTVSAADLFSNTYVSNAYDSIFTGFTVVTLRIGGGSGTLSNSVFNFPGSQQTGVAIGIQTNCFLAVVYRTAAPVVRTYNAYAIGTDTVALSTGEFRTTTVAAFTDPTNGDFSLKTGSTLINKGQA